MSFSEEINDNVSTIGPINKDSLYSAFDAQNRLVDKLINDELYNQELYDSTLTTGKRYTSDNDYKTKYFDIIDKTKESQDVMVDGLVDVDISGLLLSYNKTADMYRNQNASEKYIEGKKGKFEKRNKEILVDIDNKIKQKEIYTYYYKKYNAQKKILFNIILGSLIVIILTYLNKRYKFIFNDTFFILALGIILAVIFINICIQLIDIFFRNKINYDEYDFMFGSNYDSDQLEYTAQEKELAECDSQINAYTSVA